MIEAPKTTPELTKKIKVQHPNHANIPPELIKPNPNNSEKRGKFTENRIKELIAARDNIVENVFINNHNGHEDIAGHDLSVVLTGDSPIRIVYVQVKSRHEAITAYKKKLREKYIPESEGKTDAEKDELVKRWLTFHGIILINGSHEKSNDEIINDSFLPQLQRIQKDTKRRQNTDENGQVKLFTDNSLIQIFPDGI